MASWVIKVLCLCGFAVLSYADIPEGYILKINPECGTGGDEFATVSVVTDLNVRIKAVCKYDTSVNFTTIDGVVFVLDVGYSDKEWIPCTFVRRLHMLEFSVEVEVLFLDTKGSVLGREEYIVICTFNDQTTQQGSNDIIGLIAPAERAKGVISTNGSSIFSVELVDVLGGSLTGKQLSLGKSVQLKATTNAADLEVGFYPVFCDAVDGASRYSILRAGCGDGVILGKDQGFTTNGLVTLSPYFRVFRMKTDAVIKFECIFNTCTTACDGSSCKQKSLSHMKRSSGYGGGCSAASGYPFSARLTGTME